LFYSFTDRHAESCQLRFAAADRVRGYLGETGIRVLTRMMGLLLTAIAVQFMLNGLTDIGLVKEFAVRAYGGAWLISRPQHGVVVDAPEVQGRLRGQMKLKRSTWHIDEIL
jgi:hypothetical protein